jgi:hypothetical protein
VVWIYIRRADNDIFDSSPDYRICARPTAAGRRTRLQSDVKRRARRNGHTKIAQTLDFGMGTSCFAMVSFRHYLVVNHQDCTDGGIRTRPAERLFCFNQGSAHELFVSVRRHGLG